MNFSFVNVADAASVGELVRAVNKVIVNPLIVLMFALALGYFLYGVFEFIAGASDESKRTEGKRHMLWGIIGMFIMVSVFTIMQIIINQFGITGIDPRGGDIDLN